MEKRRLSYPLQRSDRDWEEHLLKWLLFDLDSISRGLRLSAMVQLQKFLYLPGVSRALEKRLELEGDGECRQYLQHLLWISNVKTERTLVPKLRLQSTPTGQFPSPKGKSEAPAGKPLLDRFLAATEADLPRMVETIEAIKEPERIGVIQTFLKQPDLPVSKVLSLLELAEKHYVPEMEPQVAKLLFHQNMLVVGSALQLMNRRSPATLVSHLPELLEHSPVPIRVTAIRFLFEVAPEESLRLLDEFLDDPAEDQRRLGLELAFTFPFEAIREILFGVIKDNRAQGSLLDLVKSLVKSNPDKDFLAALADLLLGGGLGHPTLGQILEVSAEALNLSGLDRRPPAEIISDALRGAEARKTKQKKSILGISTGPTTVFPQWKPPQTRNLPANVAPSPKLDHPVSPPAGKQEKEPPTSGKIDPDPAKPTPGGSMEKLSQEEFLSILDALRKDEDILEGIREIRRRKLRDPKTIKWLEKGVGPATDKIRVSTMELLAELSPKTLQPHLPLLCCHESEIVACQAIRLLRRLEGNAFIRRIQAWIFDPTPPSRLAALRGLLQADFEQTKPLILEVLERWPDADTYKQFGPVLRENPEATTVFELERLRKISPAIRSDGIDSLARSIERKLMEISGGTGEPGPDGMSPADSPHSGGALDDLIGKIRKIHYRVGKGGIQSLLGDSDHLKKMVTDFLGGSEKLWKVVGGAMGGIVILVFVIWMMTGKGGPSPTETSERPPPVPGTPTKEYSTILAVVLEIDAPNGTMKLMNAKEETFRLIEVEDPKQFAVGNRLEVTVKSMVNSYLGKVIEAESLKRIK